MISSQWAYAEFNALGELWSVGLPVPYPVQISGTEVLMEFIGDDDVSPGRAQIRPEPELLADLFEQFRVTTSELALRGWAHGDLSPYNVLLHDDRLVIIDWPQIVDIIGNPRGTRPSSATYRYAPVHEPRSGRRRGGALRRLHDRRKRRGGEKPARVRP